MVDALDKLSKEDAYKSVFTYEVVPMLSERGEASKAKYAWAEHGHGLALLDKDGNLKGKLLGHSYGREEIVALIEGARGE